MKTETKKSPGLEVPWQKYKVNEQGVPLSPKTGKPLWGAPLTIWRLSKRVAELEQSDAQLKFLSDKAASGPRSIAPSENLYPFEPWQWSRGTKQTPQLGVPIRFRHFHADDEEWVYHERLSLWTDSGYSESIVERAIGMVSNAFGGYQRPDGSGSLRMDIREQRFGPVRTDRGHEGEPTYSKLPLFSRNNEVEVIVRIRRTNRDIDAEEAALDGKAGLSSTG